MYPLKLGSTAEFQALRRLLQDCDYTEAAVCRRLRIPSIYDFKTVRERREKVFEVNDRLDALIRLLMDQEALPASMLDDHLGPQALPIFESLSVVRRLSDDPSRVYADAVLYPQEGLYICSDRTFLVETHADITLPEDVVYASITRNSGRFVSFLPPDPCESLLELCAGTGIAALIAAQRYARRSWACDLSGRCTHFARFNALLNGIENVQAVQGDLYKPVNGMRFERIVAHPPYVPAEEQRLMFRDGGQDGEQILRGIVEGIPEHLKPGGRVYALSLVTDREGEPIEQRVRKWLGESEFEYDVFLVYDDAERRPNAILQAVAEAKGKLGQLGPRSKMYERLKVETILYGVIVIERHQRQRAPLTARCQKSPRSGNEIIEWFREWQLSAAEPRFQETLTKARPFLGQGVLLTVTHEERNGQLFPVEFRMRAKHPLISDARVEPWVAALIGACDGTRTCIELFGYLKEEEVITDEMSEDAFRSVLRQLLESGFLQIEEFQLPGGTKNPLENAATAVQ